MLTKQLYSVAIMLFSWSISAGNFNNLNLTPEAEKAIQALEKRLSENISIDIFSEELCLLGGSFFLLPSETQTASICSFFENYIPSSYRLSQSNATMKAIFENKHYSIKKFSLIKKYNNQGNKAPRMKLWSILRNGLQYIYIETISLEANNCLIIRDESQRIWLPINSDIVFEIRAFLPEY